MMQRRPTEDQRGSREVCEGLWKFIYEGAVKMYVNDVCVVTHTVDMLIQVCD